MDNPSTVIDQTCCSGTSYIRCSYNWHVSKEGFLRKKTVSVGKVKVEEAAKKTAQKIFGVQIEITVQRQHYSRPIPYILVRCADILSGLNSQYLFKAERNKKVIQQLVSTYNQDFNASLPEAVNPVDVAALAKCYLASLPEPLTTFELYNEIKGASSSIYAMRNVLKKLPSVNYMTLEFVTALLLCISQKSLLNKIDASLCNNVAEGLGTRIL